MTPPSLDEPTGRYLSFAEREEAALLNAHGKGVQEIARTIGRDPGTVSREFAPGRCDQRRQAGLSRRGGAVEGTAGSQALEYREAGEQRAVVRVTCRTGSPGTPAA
jgi:IS30 family transposase